MKVNKRWSLALCASVVFGFQANAWAQSPGAGAPEPSSNLTADWQNARFFVGLRLWVTQWDVPYVAVRPASNPIHPDRPAFDFYTATSTSDTKLVPMPTVGVYAGKWLLAATLAPTTSYDCHCSLGDVDRREFDVNLGYEVVPRLFLSVGYKEATQSKLADVDQSSEVKVKAILLGANASVPLTDTLSLYGNAAYGFVRYNSDLRDPAGHSHYDGSYQIGEVGLSWRVGQFLGNAFQNTSVALGYRFQSLRVEDTPVTTSETLSFNSTPIGVAREDLRTNTSGPVITLIAYF
jgi:hypothetical protein